MGILKLAVILAFVWAVPQSNPQVRPAEIASHPADPVLAKGQLPGKVVEYKSGNLELRAVLYRPKGNGPFPVMIWNHAAGVMVNDEPELGAFYTQHGYALLVPDRRGHGGNPGKTVDDLLAPRKAENIEDPAANLKFVQLLEESLRDVAAAVSWAKEQTWADRRRVFMSGISYGGLDCLVSADTIRGIRGYVVFSGGARLFGNEALRARLERAVRNSYAPILLIQAKNDYSTLPAEKLGPLLIARHDGSHAVVYPAFGNPDDIRMGHVAFATWAIGTKIWGAEALSFMQKASKSFEDRKKPHRVL